MPKPTEYEVVMIASQLRLAVQSDPHMHRSWSDAQLIKYALDLLEEAAEQINARYGVSEPIGG